MVKEVDDGMWFAPKLLGYGAGWPIAWQGWAMLAVHIAVIMLGLLFADTNPVAAGAWFLLTALLPLPVYAAKTQGGWAWRWPWSK